MKNIVKVTLEIEILDNSTLDHLKTRIKDSLEYSGNFADNNNLISIEAMKNYTLNIGLENNPLTVDQILDIISNRTAGATIFNRLHLGEYNGNPERTLIVNFNSYKSTFAMVHFVEELCNICTQECIPVKTKNFNKLVYNLNFAGGKFDFNPDYFIEY